MPRFFCDNIIDNTIQISGEDAKHIAKVLRMQIGNTITVCNGNRMDYECEITAIGDEVSLCILKQHANETEPGINITLYQALPKSDKFDFIIQKAVELGVTRIVAMQTKFCVSRLDAESFAKKQIRFNKIAFEAAKQAGRGIIPKVCSMLDFEAAISQSLPADNCSILYYEHGGIKTNQIITTAHTNVNIYIGSEGGFSEEEIDFAQKNNVSIGTLGNLILRCETAPVVALSLVLQATGNM